MIARVMTLLDRTFKNKKSLSEPPRKNVKTKEPSKKENSDPEVRRDAKLKRSR